MQPDNYGAWDNYGQTLQALGRMAEAEDAYRRALTLKPDDADVHYHLALIALLQGRLREGFAAYHWRTKAVKAIKHLAHAAPVWDGADPRGKTILVADEQGFGDSLMCARFLPLLRDRGARVVYACRQPLRPLFENWDGVDAVIDAADAIDTPCDAHCLMMDLPHLLGIDETSLTPRMPYLTAPAGDVPPALTSDDGLKVGLAWMGSKHHKHDAKRSMPCALMAQLAQTPNLRCFGLIRREDQRDGDAAILADAGIVDLGDALHDFAATARIIMALDLVITVDTSTAHLAGALGKPVWVLLPFAPDWRWQLARQDSPWYPTARLWRQPRPGDWNAVLGAVSADLSRLKPSSTR